MVVSTPSAQLESSTHLCCDTEVQKALSLPLLGLGTFLSWASTLHLFCIWPLSIGSGIRGQAHPLHEVGSLKGYHRCLLGREVEAERLGVMTRQICSTFIDLLGSAFL